MQFDVSWPWLMTAAVLFVGCWVQTAIGFGMAVVAAPVVILVKPEWVPYVLTTTALVLSVINAWNQRKALRPRLIFPAFIWRVPGTVLGTWLLLNINVLWLNFIVASCVLLAVAVSLTRIQFQPTGARLGWAGFVSGIMGTTTSIGGPPLALVMQFAEPSVVRANLSIYFAFSCILSLLGYGATGLLVWTDLLLHASFIPVAVLGFLVGIATQPWVDQGRFRPLLLVVCGVSGTFALMGVLWKMLL